MESLEKCVAGLEEATNDLRNRLHDVLQPTLKMMADEPAHAAPSPEPSTFLPDRIRRIEDRICALTNRVNDLISRQVVG